MVSACGARSLGAAQSFKVKAVPNLPRQRPSGGGRLPGETAEAGRWLSVAAELGDRRPFQRAGQTWRGIFNVEPGGKLGSELTAFGTDVFVVNARPVEGDPVARKLAKTLKIRRLLGFESLRIWVQSLGEDCALWRVSVLD
jgi:hypothetical protein